MWMLMSIKLSNNKTLCPKYVDAHVNQIIKQLNTMPEEYRCSRQSNNQTIKHSVSLPEVSVQ